MKKTKNITALTLGIVASLINVFTIFLLVFAFIIGSISAGLDDKNTIIVVAIVAMLVATSACLVLGITASVFSLRRARVASIMYLVCTILALATVVLYITISSSLTIAIIPMLLSLLLYLLATIFEFLAKTPHNKSPIPSENAPNSTTANN